MAKKSGEELSILDMDFGDFLSPESGFENPDVPEEEEIKEEPKEKEEEEIDINEALEEKAQEKDTEDEEEPPASLKDSEDEPFTLVLARYQLEQGVLSSLDEDKLQKIIKEDGEAAAFSYLIQNEVDNNSEEVIKQLDTYSKEYTELRKSGFSAEEAGNTVMTLESLASISEEDMQDEEKEDLRRMILKENYKATTSFSESKIDRLVKRAFDINADVEDAVEALESLKETKQKELEDAKKAQKQQQEDAQTAYNNQLQELNKHIDSLEEIIPGKKINKQTKTKISDVLTKPVKQSEEGYSMNAIWAKRSEDQTTFDTTLAYLFLSGVFDGKWDQIVKSVNTTLTDKLEKKLNSGAGSSLMGGKHTIQMSEAEKRKEDMIGPMRHLFGND